MLLFKWGLEDSAVSYPVYVIGLYLVVAWSISLPGAVRRLRAAMFASFSGGGDIPNAATGAGVCLLILFMAAAIVAWAGRGVRYMEAAQGRAHEIDKE